MFTAFPLHSNTLPAAKITMVLEAAGGDHLGIGMELDLVDYSKDPLENVNIWKTPRPSTNELLPFCYDLSATIASLPSILGPSCSRVTFSEPPPIWPFPPLLPQSPSTVTFISAYLNLNPKVPSSESPLSSHPDESSTNPLRTNTLAQGNPQFFELEAPPSGGYMAIPPLSESILVVEHPCPENPNPNPNQSVEILKDPEESSWKGKKEVLQGQKRRCYPQTQGAHLVG